MQIQLTGTVHGRTIELDSATQFSEGQRVELTVVPLAAVPAWGEGLRQAAGVMSDVPEFEQIMQDVHRMRSQERPGANLQ